MVEKRLDFYIIKKFLGTYVFAIALIISIAVVFDFNEKMDRFMSHEAPLESHNLRLLSEFHSLLCKPVQSVVCVYCGYFLYLKTG